MTSFWVLLRTELRLFLREPAALFFNVAFPVLLLVIMGPVFGNEAAGVWNGYGTVDLYIPSFTALAIGAYSLIGIPITLASYREQGVLRRYRATPMPRLAFAAAHAGVGLIVILGTALLLVATGAAAFALRWPSAPLQLLPALAFGTLTFLSIGFALGWAVRTTRQAQAVGNVLFFPMLFLSGAAMPRSLFPDWMQTLGDALPLTYVVTLLTNLWIGEGWDPVSILVLVAVAVLSLATVAVLVRST